MQIVIDIPDDIYSAIVKQYRKDKELQIRDNLYKAIANGTPLPKGHGRLFLLDEEIVKEYLTSFSFSSEDWISEVDISKATLKVLEADKED